MPDIAADGAAVAVGATNDSPDTTPLDLIASCWEPIYDHLSFKDIFQLRQTCKAFNTFSNRYISEECHARVKFDNLSFDDIIRMGQTCNEMSQLSGNYIRQYYPQLEFEWVENGQIFFRDICLRSDFYPFIGRMTFYAWDTIPNVETSKH